MHSEEEVAQIAKGLTKAQREALTFNTEVDGQVRVVPRHFYSQTLASLERRGLMAPDYWLTPLGLAVRTYLQDNPNG